MTLDKLQNRIKALLFYLILTIVCISLFPAANMLLNRIPAQDQTVQPLPGCTQALEDLLDSMTVTSLQQPLPQGYRTETADGETVFISPSALLGVLMVLMALQTWELFNFIPSTYLVSRNKRRGYLGALLAGILGGIFSSPCATPVLVVLLAIVAGKGSVIWGVLLLFLYSVGHGALTVFAGTSVGVVRNIARDNRYGVFSSWLKWIMGGLILLIGFYMFYLAF